MKHIVLTFLLLGLFTSAHADFIVNTGSGPSGNVGGISYNVNQFLAAQFEVTEKTTIKSIEAWITTNGGTDIQTGTLVIYNNRMGGFPGTELFSTPFTSLRDSDASWEGADGLGWMVEMGTYWAAFEVRDGQNYSGTMGTPVERSLDVYAFIDVIQNEWQIFTPGFGIRIHADTTVIPIPAAVWLFGSAMLGLVGWSHRKTKS